MGNLEPVTVVKQTETINTATVILLHGSGLTSESFLTLIESVVGPVALPHVKFLLPTAPLQQFTPVNRVKTLALTFFVILDTHKLQPKQELKLHLVTLSLLYMSKYFNDLAAQLRFPVEPNKILRSPHLDEMHVWFDRYCVSPDAPENLKSLEQIRPKIVDLINEEIKAGIPLNRILIGGHSMGGCLSLHTAYRFIDGLGGVFAISAFLNTDSILYKEFNQSNTPLFITHGDNDNIVPYDWGVHMYENLTKRGVVANWLTLKGADHKLNKEGIEAVLEFIKKSLPQI